jgi:hypothetical protein
MLVVRSDCRVWRSGYGACGLGYLVFARGVAQTEQTKNPGPEG